MSDDLVQQLRARSQANGGMFPDAMVDAAADRIETLKALLEQRDAFIVSKDLWFDFVDGLTLAGEKKDE